MKKIDIVFMGTPEFATTILDKLYSEDTINIVGVVTAPDKPAGRGRKIQSSSVKEFALSKNLHILQPTNLKDSSFVEELKNLEAQLFVVVAFRMLPEIVWSMPELGTINLHASILPQYRGAAPINWAIINGEKETGVTTFFIEKEIDTGAIIEQQRISIEENMNVGELYNKLMHLGANATLSTVKKIMNGEASGIPQDEITEVKNLKPAPKIFKNTCHVDFNQEVEVVHNFCRGLDPYPGAWTFITTKNGEKKTVKLFDTYKTNIRVSKDTPLSSDANGILMACSDYYIRICEIQLEGKRRMNFKDFLLGHNIDDYHL